jgi:hypothetical protein
LGFLNRKPEEKQGKELASFLNQEAERFKIL